MLKQVNSIPPTPRSRHRTKSCPFCAEAIRYEAVKCRYCGEFLYGDRRETAVKFGLLPPEPEMDEGEQDEFEEEQDDLLWCGRPSVLALGRTLIATTLLIGVCWAVFKYPVTALVAYVDALIPPATLETEMLVRVEGWLDLGALVLMGLAALVLLCRIVALKSIYYEVTPDRIEWSRGIFDRQVDNIDMFRVIDLKLRRSLLEAILGIGTVTLTTKDDSEPHFDFVKVGGCRDLYNVIKEAGLEADKIRNVIHME